MYKYETHVHTKENDIVATSSGAEIVRRYHDAGYSGIIVTDHYFSLFFDWFKEELEGLQKNEIITRWLKGYYSAKNEGEKLGFTVLSGAEVRFDGTINDYLVYGVEPEFFYSAPLLNRLKSIDELLSVLPKEARVVQAHPFRDNMTVTNPNSLFGIEVYNGATEPIRNELANTFAKHYEKKMLSGSDYHRPDNFGRGGICTFKKITSPSDLVSVLDSGEYKLIKDGIVE